MTWLLRSIDQSLRASAARAHARRGSSSSLAAGRPGRAVELEPDQVRHEEEEAAAGGGEPARREGEAADVGDRLHRGPRLQRALVVEAPGERGKPLGLRISRTAVGLSGSCCALRCSLIS